MVIVDYDINNQILNLRQDFQMILFFTFTFLFQAVLSLYTVRPTWVTSNLVRAGNKNIITTRTGNNLTPTYIFLFSSSLSATPYLGYGVKRYEGTDYFGEQKFQVQRINLDSTSFQVSVHIAGSTYILCLNVPYIAIQPSFPYHINSFDNVPVNYSAGPIVNISVASPDVQTYTNLINYTQQAAGLTYTTFKQPFNRNKVLLFLTTFYQVGTNQNGVQPFRPINYTMNSQVISQDQYKLQVTLSISISLQRLHFSILIFDQYDIISSGEYVFVYEKIDLPYTGGFVPVPVQFIDNFIMGLLDFSTNKTQVILDFQWDFLTINGVHGAFMPQSVGQPHNPPGGNQTINRVTYTLFYMKTWSCPILTFFDLSKDLCTQCPIHNCVACFNLTVCELCNQPQNFYLLGSVCYKCSNEGNNQKDLCTLGFEILPGSYRMQKKTCNQFELFLSTDSEQFHSKFSTLYFLNNGVNIIQRQVNNNNFYLNVQYDRDIGNETLVLLAPNSSIEMRIQSNSGIPLIKYEEEECKTFEWTKKMILPIQIISYILLLFSLISGKIVGLELFGVLQLAYFSLAEHDFLNIYLSHLTSFKIFNGLNLGLFSETENILPGNLQALNISDSSFINNCNIMLLLLFLELLIGFALYLTSRIIRSVKLQRISQRMLKEGFITLVMFNILNISFSAGIHWKYFSGIGTIDIVKSVQEHGLNILLNYSLSIFSMVVLYSTLIAIVVCLFYLQYSEEEFYGEFKLKFKDNCVCRSYITVQVLYRMALGFYISLQNDYPEVTLLILAFSLAFILFNVTNLPFQNTFQNYRSNMIHFTELMILISANYYRSMKLNTPIQIKGHIHSPAVVELIMILICIIVSAAGLIYQISKFLIKCYKQRRIRKVRTSHPTDKTMQNIIQQRLDS